MRKAGLKTAPCTADRCADSGGLQQWSWGKIGPTQQHFSQDPSRCQAYGLKSIPRA